MDRTWIKIEQNLYVYNDSCVVWAIVLENESLIVNAGTGRWLDAVDELPKPPRVVALTHFFRDHTSGATRAHAAGLQIWAPYWERELLSDPEGHFQRRETYIIYDNAWDLYAPAQSIPVSRWLMDWEVVSLGGATMRVLPTPGASPRAVSYEVTSRGEVGIFCGETIHGPGKIHRVAPLQYDYNGLPGANNLLYSLRQLEQASPAWLASSTSAALITDPSSAMELLRDNLLNALATRNVAGSPDDFVGEDSLIEITPHLYQSKLGMASTYFLISDSGKCLSIDYGYRFGAGGGGDYAFPRNRRPLLHGIEPLQDHLGIEKIDAVLVTHFHDDHVCGIPLLQRLYGTSCFASETFAHILAHPSHYAFPCTWPEPIDVVSLANDSPFRWEEFEFTLHPISGHTRFATFLTFTVDGEQVIATGDQYFYQDFDHPGAGAVAHNHVYRNGAVLGSMRESMNILSEVDPTLILPGHGSAYRPPEGWSRWIARYTEEYESIHRALMPLAGSETHFEVDSRAAWIEPCRITLPEAAPVTIKAHVRNPHPHRATITLRLIVPEGWTTDTTRIDLEARAEGSVGMELIPAESAICRRQAVTLEMESDTALFGEVAEALVTIGSNTF